MNAEAAAKKERARIADGLAAGKTFYLRGGKKLKGKKAEVGAEKPAPAVSPGTPPSGDTPPSTKPPKEAGKRDK